MYLSVDVDVRVLDRVYVLSHAVGFCVRSSSYPGLYAVNVLCNPEWKSTWCVE